MTPFAMPSHPTAKTLNELALAAFLASLGEAEKRADASYQAYLDKKQAYLDKKQEFRDAIKQLSDSHETVTAYKVLIAQHSLQPDKTPEVHGKWVADVADEQGLSGEEKEGNETGELSSPKRKRERLNAAGRLLELIKRDGFFKTADQLVEMLQNEFGDRIKEKTSKNAVWMLNGDNSIKKYYSKEHTAYVYGLPEWFLNDKPSPQHLHPPYNPLAALPPLDSIVNEYGYLEPSENSASQLLNDPQTITAPANEAEAE
jgi:hypothetical protein